MEWMNEWMNDWTWKNVVIQHQHNICLMGLNKSRETSSQPIFWAYFEPGTSKVGALFTFFLHKSRNMQWQKYTTKCRLLVVKCTVLLNWLHNAWKENDSDQWSVWLPGSAGTSGICGSVALSSSEGTSGISAWMIFSSSSSTASSSSGVRAPVSRSSISCNRRKNITWSIYVSQTINLKNLHPLIHCT